MNETPRLASARRGLAAARDLIDRLRPGTVAQLEQHATAGRTALAAYGVDLDEPADRTVVLAVVAVLGEASMRTPGAEPWGAYAALADLEQALISATRTPSTRSST